MYLPPFSITGAQTVGEIVARDYRTAEVLAHYGIDYSSDSSTAISAICEEKGIDFAQLQTALITSTRTIQLSNSLPFNEWKVEFLIDYIINVHHEYIRRKLPQLFASIYLLADEEVDSEVNITGLQKAFDSVYNYLLTHINNEETSVFPYLKQITSAWFKKESYGSLLVKTLRKPVEKTLLNEHEKLNELMLHLRKVTNAYSTAGKFSLRYQVIMKQMQEFDNDLVQHIFLENKVLFPKVMVIEKELLSISA